MTEQEKQLFQSLFWGLPRKHKLMSNKRCISRFLRQFRPHLSDAQRLKIVIEEAIQSQDAQEVQIVVSIIHRLGYSENHFPLLEKLFREEWHCSHEDMVMNFQDFESDKSIDALGWAAQVRLKSLEADDSEALARKAIYALAKIPSQQAQEKLQSIADNSDGQRRKWAVTKIKEQATSTSISRLAELFPPTAALISTASDRPWHDVEAALGFELPDDYIKLVDIYETQSFVKDVAISLTTPFSKDGAFKPDNSLFNWIESGRRNYLAMQNSFGKRAPEKFPFPVHPQPNGLLAFGGIETGGTIYWVTKGEPHEWTLVLYDEEFYEYEQYDLSLSEFLVQWLSGQLTSEILETSQ